jgi:hypothetical protein
MTTKTQVVTICGSMRFWNEILETAKLASLAGQIVLAPFVRISPEEQLTSEAKVLLDVLHFRKIDLSEGIIVVRVNNYIGESTSREIDYARASHKTIKFADYARESEHR